MSPNRDVVKSQFVPPPVEHRLIESQDSLLCDRGGGWGELTQSIVDKSSLRIIDASQQMPQRERIASASLAQHDRSVVIALLRSAVFKVESRQCGAEFRGPVLEVRCGPDFRPCRASRSRRDE